MSRMGLSAVEGFLKGGGGSSNKGGPTGRWTSYFLLGDGESKVIRFLTDVDQLAVAEFYEFVMDKNGKFQTFVNAPSYYADDPSWRGEDWVRKFGGKCRVYGSNEMEDPRPKTRVVGIAVEREEVPTQVNGRRVMTTQDLLTQVEDRDGKSLPARNFFIVKQTATFWNAIMGYHAEFGTLCDRDYKITRHGTGTAISYSVIPKNPDPDWNDDGSSLAALQARYGYGTGADVDGNPLTAESEDRFLYIGQTLDQWLENQASEERARAALVGDNAPSLDSPRSEAPSWSAPAQDEPIAAATGSVGASLRERLERHQ